VKWLEIAATQPRLSLMSALADWEQSVVTGHPTHPVFFLIAFCVLYNEIDRP
jgi:hypothetical protein